MLYDKFLYSARMFSYIYPCQNATHKPTDLIFFSVFCFCTGNALCGETPRRLWAQWSTVVSMCVPARNLPAHQKSSFWKTRKITPGERKVVFFFFKTVINDDNDDNDDDDDDEE